MPAWTFSVTSNPSTYNLRGEDGTSAQRVQIDVFGDPAGRGADCIRLARAIHAVLNGFCGALPDSDHTVVDGCFRTNMTDFFNDASRSYRRMLEYDIWVIAQ